MILFWCFRDERVSFTRVAEALARPLSARRSIAMVDWGTRAIFARWSEGQRETCDAPLPSSPRLSVGFGDFRNLSTMIGARRIASVVWETSRLRSSMRRWLRGLDEMWVPTRWVRDLLVRHGFDRADIHRVPHGVDTDLFTPADSRRKGPFRFISVGKWENRKGHDVLLRAFSRCFPNTQDVELVLHCGVRPNDEAVGAALRRWTSALPSNVTFSTPLESDQMPLIYQRADAFVLATRGEGWGLPISEAMSCGLPVLVTDCSGPKDFVDASVGYPIRVSARPAAMDDYHYPPLFRVIPRYGRWFEPDEDHLCEIMREVVSQPDEARRRGAAARKAIVARWTWHHAAQIAEARLAHWETARDGSAEPRT